MLSGFENNFAFTLQRAFLFLFFNAAYAFLTFWIAASLFLFFPFAIFGFLLFLFVVFFQKGICGIISRNELAKGKGHEKIPGLPFVLGIAFLIIYLIGVYFLQGLVIRQFRVPSALFSIVGWVLTIISLGISFGISFAIQKNQEKQAPTKLNKL